MGTEKTMSAMEKPFDNKNFGKKNDEFAKCPVCEVYVHQDEGFLCPRCKKSPLCRKHRVSGRRECASCVFDLTKKELQVLRSQEGNIKQFLRFLQFIFLVFAVFFVSFKFGLTEYIEILKDMRINTFLAYLGVLPVTFYILFMIILYNQRSKIADIEVQIRKLEVRK